MSAIRMLFSWLTEKGIFAMNPAREVKTEKFSRTEGKTPASRKTCFSVLRKRPIVQQHAAAFSS
jgi:site-specific recombinase XerC